MTTPHHRRTGHRGQRDRRRPRRVRPTAGHRDRQCLRRGLPAGIALAVKAGNPNAQVYTAEPQDFDDHARSFRSGHRETNRRHVRINLRCLDVALPGQADFRDQSRAGGAKVSSPARTRSHVRSLSRSANSSWWSNPAGRSRSPCCWRERSTSPAKSRSPCCPAGMSIRSCFTSSWPEAAGTKIHARVEPGHDSSNPRALRAPLVRSAVGAPTRKLESAAAETVSAAVRLQTLAVLPFAPLRFASARPRALPFVAAFIFVKAPAILVAILPSLRGNRRNAVRHNGDQVGHRQERNYE